MAATPEKEVPSAARVGSQESASSYVVPEIIPGIDNEFYFRMLELENNPAKQAEEWERQAVEMVEYLKKNEEVRRAFRGFMGLSKAHRRVMEKCAAIAKSNKPVYINGESGTGKELVARAIHILSGRRGKFQPYNCAFAPDDNMQISELFGHDREALSGVPKSRAGLFESANNGTVFLDDLGYMPLRTQAYLNRVVEYGKYSRLGSDEVLETNARIISAFNRPLIVEDLDEWKSYCGNRYWQQIEEERSMKETDDSDICTVLFSASPHLAEAESMREHLRKKLKEEHEHRLNEDLAFRICVKAVRLMPLRKSPIDAIAVAAYYRQQDRNWYGDMAAQFAHILANAGCFGNSRAIAAGRLGHNDSSLPRFIDYGPLHKAPDQMLKAIIIAIDHAMVIAEMWKADEKTESSKHQSPGRPKKNLEDEQAAAVLAAFAEHKALDKAARIMKMDAKTFTADLARACKMAAEKISATL